jgi:hypothetical protein
MRIETFRKDSRRLIRNSFIEYFNNNSEFDFHELSVPDSELDILIRSNFKRLNGKCFRTNTGTLIIAKHQTDNSIDDLLQSSIRIMLRN